jgi:hypothetical protein
LIAAVTQVFAMKNGLDAQSLGDFRGVVAASIIDQQDLIDQIKRQIAIGSFDRPGGPVRGKNHDHLLIMQHREPRKTKNNVNEL